MRFDTHQTNTTHSLSFGRRREIIVRYSASVDPSIIHGRHGADRRRQTSYVCACVSLTPHFCAVARTLPTLTDGESAPQID